MIEVKNLVKKYGDHTAVDHLSFHVDKGQIYGFLGPNGAGKSTTMNIMTGYIASTLSCRIWKEKNMQWNTVSSHLVVRTQPMNVVRNARMQKIWAMAVWFFAVTLCVSRQKKRKINL